MKLHLLALALAVSGVCAADQTIRDIRISLQWIELPHPVLTELTGGEKQSGPAIHDAVMAHVKEGKAMIVETGIVVCRSGRKSVIESIREEIYPVEFPSSNVQWTVGPTAEQLASIPLVNPRLRSITAFQTRNTGLTIEVEPTLTERERVIELRFTAEVLSPDRLVTWMEHKDQWGDASVRMPVYEKWSTNTALSLTPGKFELVSVISPKPTEPVPAVFRKILLFVRADVL